MTGHAMSPRTLQRHMKQSGENATWRALMIPDWSDGKNFFEAVAAINGYSKEAVVLRLSKLLFALQRGDNDE